MATPYDEPYHQETISEKVGKTISTNAPIVTGKVISIALFGFVRIFRGILNTIREAIRGY
jgi:hypothetical protein